MVYQWKPNVSIKGLKAQAAGETLEKLRKKHKGRLTAESVLNDAKRTKSKLHAAFEWDDTTAASAYRLDQARYMIRSIVVIAEKDGIEHPPVRAFVQVVQEDQKHYTSIQHAMSEQDLREQVMQRALNELLDWQRRYRDLRQFTVVFQAITELDPV